MTLLAYLLLAGAFGWGVHTIQLVPTDGPDEQGYRWEKTLAEIPKDRCPVERVSDVFLKCDQRIHAAGCTRRDEEAKTCVIYLPKGNFGEGWETGHEDRHRQGWVHPDWTGGTKL